MRNRSEYSMTRSCWNLFLIYKIKTRRFSIENHHSHWFSEVKVKNLNCSFSSALIEKRKVHYYCSDFVSAFVKRADDSKDLKTFNNKELLALSLNLQNENSSIFNQKLPFSLVLKGKSRGVEMLFFVSADRKEKRKVHCYCNDLAGAFVERADYSK